MLPGCILKWHRIEKGRVLDEKEMEFIVALIMGWIGGQINEKGAQLCEKNLLRAAKIGDFILDSGNFMEVHRK